MLECLEFFSTDKLFLYNIKDFKNWEYYQTLCRTSKCYKTNFTFHKLLVVVKNQYTKVCAELLSTIYTQKVKYIA